MTAQYRLSNMPAGGIYLQEGYICRRAISAGRIYLQEDISV
jgi:hypothetical protein